MRPITTIVTPPTTTALTTVARVQDELGISASQAKKRGANLIADASALICNYCDRQFGRATIKQILPGPVVPYPYSLIAYQRLPRMRLRYLPIQSIVSASYNSGIIDPTTIVFNPETGHIYGESVPLYDTITYIGGYALPNDSNRDLPQDIERACLDTVSMLWWRSGTGGRDPMVKMDVVEKVGSTSYFNPTGGNEDSLPPTAVAALQKYRSVNI